MSEPENVVEINTSSHEVNPSISSDNLTLYFGRTAANGYLDIFVTKRPSVDSPWEEPKNLGPIVNTQYDDKHPSISPDGKALYFSYQSTGPPSIWVTHLNQPPIAVCQDIEISADENCQAMITPEDVDGGSYDPDGDDYTLSIDNIGPLSLGENHINLTITDVHGESDTCQASVVVIDTTPPVPDITNLPTIVGECTVEITSVPTATDYCAGLITASTTDPLNYSEVGTFLINWTYDDGHGNTTSQTQTVVVQDITPPQITLSLSPNILWPPNHKMILITPTIVAYDNCDPNPTVMLISITMNEGDETNTYDPNYDSNVGDGNTIDDIQVDENGNIYLRAERQGTGTGRIYTITYTATDASGNSTNASTTVTVPHNQ